MRHLGSTLVAAILATGCGSAVDSRNEPAAQQREAVTTLSIPNQMPSIIAIDKANMTVTLPLRRGRGPDGRAAYFVLTDTSDLSEAVRLGINWAPKLTHALGTAAVQSARVHGDDDSELSVSFSGGVDFRPVRVVVPGEATFRISASLAMRVSRSVARRADSVPPRLAMSLSRSTAVESGTSKPTTKSPSISPVHSPATPPERQRSVAISSGRA